MIVAGDVADADGGIDHDRPGGRDEDDEDGKRLRLAERDEGQRQSGEGRNGPQDLEQGVEGAQREPRGAIGMPTATPFAAAIVKPRAIRSRVREPVQAEALVEPAAGVEGVEDRLARVLPDHRRGGSVAAAPEAARSRISVSRAKSTSGGGTTSRVRFARSRSAGTSRERPAARPVVQPASTGSAGIEVEAFTLVTPWQVV